ncbi:DUF397 domain-containing protein [Streptomyces scabiei]|uniref:DUF397 domain-containing protein n=1 Tax=Streptomyces scabiei TaxID=1930 RepID=UPI00298F223E|nr:DUF397 domain-containing protein [Streptomyces scabiei]MDW8478338.1 DUF397 domain-containing protein [Streptomyces scabiei]
MTRPIPPQSNPEHPAWWKASYSSENGACVEVAHIPAGSGCMAVRDSKITDGPHLVLSAKAFTALVDSVSTGTI